VPSNREIVTRAFAAWSNGTGNVTSIFAKDMTWEIVGHSAASRKYANKQEFIDEVLAPFGARFSTEKPFRPVAIRGIYADDASSIVIVLWDGSGITRTGRRYENTYAWFMTLRDGAVVDGTAFYDSLSFNELWKTVPPASTPSTSPGSPSSTT
jgi:ketosteroid isomerase-like protein